MSQDQEEGDGELLPQLQLTANESLERFLKGSPFKISNTTVSSYDEAKRKKQQKSVSSQMTPQQMQLISEKMAQKKQRKNLKIKAGDIIAAHGKDRISIPHDMTNTVPVSLQRQIKDNETDLPWNKLLHKDPHLMLPPSALVTADQPWYQPYPTTLGLILLLHLVFLHQWNRQRTKKQLLVTYRILIQRKHYHLGLLALLSHPPTQTDNDTISSFLRTAVDIGHAQNNSNSNIANFYTTSFQYYWRRFQEILHPLFNGHLSGLPLLCYNSHILWSCRSLEVLSPNFILELQGLAVVALLVEFQITHYLLTITRQHMDADLRIRGRKLLTQRGIGSLTGVSAALLIRYRLLIPYVPLQVLPIISTSAWLNGTVSYCLAILLLTVLSWKTHVCATWCGTISGILWTMGITSWLGEAYWGTQLALWILLASILSFHGSGSNALSWFRIPIVDYVEWDTRGRMPGESDSDDDTDDEEDSSMVDPEQPPAIRGRLPLMIPNDEEEEESWTIGHLSAAAPRRRGNHNR